VRIDYASHDGPYRRRKERGAEGWDESGESYETYKSEWRTLVGTYPIPREGKLLEIGCGAGNFTVWLAQQGYEAYGIDIAPAAVEWAKERAEKENVTADFRVGSVVELAGYEDEAFDVVADGHCLHCIIGDDRGECVASALRVLKPGGWFVVNTMCRTEKEITMEGFDPASGIVFNKDLATRYIGTEDAILDEVTASGFAVRGTELKTEDQDKDNGIATLIVAAQKKGAEETA